MEIEPVVYFRREDYAGFWRRAAVEVVDVAVVGIVCSIVAIPVMMALPSYQAAIRGLLLAWAVVAFIYLVLFKRSRWGTVGYRIGGVIIVGLDGRTPSIATLTSRLLFSLLSPTFILDSAWLSGDPHRQALRDKFANTYVVKRSAAPAGIGKIVFWNYDILCYNFLFREVEPEAPVPQ